MALTMRNPDGSTAVDPSAYMYLDPTAISLTDAIPHVRHALDLGHPGAQCKGKTLGSGGTVTVQITGGPVPCRRAAVVVNLTAINHSAGGTYVTAYPAGDAVPRRVEHQSWRPGCRDQSRHRAAQRGRCDQHLQRGRCRRCDRRCRRVFRDTHGSGTVPGEFHSIPPLRICDTRAGAGTECAGASERATRGRHVASTSCSPACRAGARAGHRRFPRTARPRQRCSTSPRRRALPATYLAVAPPTAATSVRASRRRLQRESARRARRCRIA